MQRQILATMLVLVGLSGAMAQVPAPQGAMAPAPFAPEPGAAMRAPVVAPGPADFVLLNAAVVTMVPEQPRASAVVITADRIRYVGDDAGARAHIGPATRVFDLQQRMVLPGFQDSHVHPADAPNPRTALDLHGLTTRDQVFERIRSYAQAHPEKRWIVGDGWDEAVFLPSGQPDRQMLDLLVPDRPAYLTNNSGHEGWANSHALAAAAIDEHTPDPANGRIERDAQGRASGALQEESAMELVERQIPPTSEAEIQENLGVALQEMSRLGYTALEDAMATPEIARAYAALEQRGALLLRSHLCMPFRPLDDDEAQVQAFLAQRTALAGLQRVHADCVKLFLDGAYGSHTVVLIEPYSDDAARFGRGKLFIAPERLNRLVTRLDAAGFQIHVHAQGDGAVRAALDAFAAARAANGPRDARHTIAHLCLIDPADLPRFRELGVVANMSPLWSLGDAWETLFAPRLFGPQRSQRLLPTHTLLQAGARLVWGSDWPVTAVSALEGLETATTHRYPGGRNPEGKADQVWNPTERVSLEQALAAYTQSGAYLVHEETERGTVAAGKLADLVVLHQDLFTVPALDIHAVPVDMTIVGGRVAYQRPAP